MQELSQLINCACSMRDKLIQHLKTYGTENLRVATMLAEINLLSDQNKRDLKILEACVYTLKTSLTSVLIEKVILLGDPSLHSAIQNLKVSYKVTSDKRCQVIVVCIDKLDSSDLNKLYEALVLYLSLCNKS